MQLFGRYDVVVVGAGVTGVVASVAAAREGARTLLVEASGLLGGLITGGRLTKPTGFVQPGVYRELIERTAGLGGADPDTRESYWGTYTGVFDPELMQRAIIETLEESGVEVLLFATATDVVRDGPRVRGLHLHTKGGPALVLAHAVVDTTGDGDVAALSGAGAMVGRPEDGRTQPMTSYFRILGVDIPRLVDDCRRHPDDLWELVVPEGASTNADYVLRFFMTGFTQRIERARGEGFAWSIPKNHVTLKTGLLPGEVNVNVTRVHGDALDPRQRTNAALTVRKQAYCAFDFLKRYVDGFQDAVFFDLAPVLGVRETRRIRGDYVLSDEDVRTEARFDDAIGLCNAPVDIHDPAGEKGIMVGVGSGYGIPYRALLPAGVDGLLVAGRCISVEAVAFGSTRNTPACALTGQAAGAAAALAARREITPRELPARAVQDALSALGVVLGRTADDRLAGDQVGAAT
ncbi:MAG: FAD-dependent oxidoreductase [Streptosporangiales bacterium]|nr:FAD-dependent oxidoreductase [Streptosporangiales bacterium]